MRVKEISVGITTIKKMIDSGKGRDYATFLYLKSICKKGCFYDYTQAGISEHSGISRSAIAKYIKRFLDYGWCHRHGKNLMFKGLKHYKQTGFNKTFILQSKSIKGIIKELYYLILKTKQAQFNKLKSMARATKTAKSPKRIRKLESFFEKFNLRKENLPSKNDMLKISSEKLGEMFGCSRSKANRIVNSFNKSKVRIVNGKRRGIITPFKTIWDIECNKYIIH
jgi:biotin operon repressor